MLSAKANTIGFLQQNISITRHLSSKVFFSGHSTADLEGPLTSSKDAGQSSIKQSLNIPFAGARLGPFRQAPPKLENSFSGDYMLQGYLRRVIPKDAHHEISSDLFRFGDRVALEVHPRGRECELHRPYIRHYDAWGNRVDDIVTTEGWKWMKKLSAEEGLIAIPYEKRHGEWSRMHQLVKHLLYNPSAGLYTCPLAMTDGAAEILQHIPSLSHAYKHLTSRDPDYFWTSGQWMTEKGGGSDVGTGTETMAVPNPDGTYRLYGYKWFSSATDSDMTLTLARVADDGEVTKGSRGLTMFYVEVRDAKKQLNGIQVIRLKEKLGTRQLPTAELLLDGCKAVQLGKTGEGIKNISTMLELTRIHTGLAGAAGMRRMVSLARDYATRRSAFGRVLLDHPLHMRTLASMELETRGCIMLVLHAARLLGLKECNKETERENLVLRLLTPLLKMYISKQSVAIASEGLECFGGAGYLEDTGLPTILRDLQVLPIWEGTTNIISLDVLRATAKSKGLAIVALKEDLEERLKSVQSVHLVEDCKSLKRSMSTVSGFLTQADPQEIEVAARDLSTSLARIYIGSLLLEHAAWSEASEHDIVAAQRWCRRQDLCPLEAGQKSGQYKKSITKSDIGLVMEGYHTKNLLADMQ